MLRALFTAVGVALLILGAECLVVEKAVLAGAPKPPPIPASPFQEAASPRPISNHELRPPEWAPWSLLSAGAVLVLYSLTFKRDG